MVRPANRISTKRPDSIASAALAPTSSAHNNTVTSMAFGQAGWRLCANLARPAVNSSNSSNRPIPTSGWFSQAYPANSAAGPTAFSQGVRGEGVSVRRSWR